MKKGLIIGGIVVGVVALAWWLSRQANLLKQICFNFSGYKINKLTREQISIEVNLSLKNQSDVDIIINSYSFDVFINGAYVTKVSSQKSQKIGKNTFSTISLDIDIEPKKNKDLKNWDFLSRILLDVNNTKIKIAGSVSATALGISAGDVPVSLEMKLKEMMPDSKNPSPPCK